MTLLDAVRRYTPEQLYSVVSQVEHYKEFVPWCERSTVMYRKDDTYMEAELEVGFKVFVERWASVQLAVCLSRVSSSVASSD